MASISKIKSLLDVPHPVSGAWNVDDQLAADQGNALDIDAPGGVDGMLQYVIENRSRTNSGTDLTATSILGRLIAMSKAEPPADPFGGGTNSTMEMVHAALMFVFLLNSPQISTANFTNTEVDAMIDILSSGAGNGKVWKAADATALKALSLNTQSLFQSEGQGVVRVGDITLARSI